MKLQMLMVIICSLMLSCSTVYASSNDLKIERISLYFENKRPEITVDLNVPVKVSADLHYTGSGLFEGHWEVDGRVLSLVSSHLTGAGVFTLQSPEAPLLPTFDPGTHIVRFVVTVPSHAVSPSTALYFVTPKEKACTVVNITTLAPTEGEEIQYAPVVFSWEKVRESTRFLVAFYEKPEDKPIFSAYAKEAGYTIPNIILTQFFKPGQKYYWKVMGFDAENQLICEHKQQTFTFRKKPLK